MRERLHPRIRVRPCRTARRRAARWRGLAAEIVDFPANGFEYEFCAPCHLLIASDRGIRSHGETRVEGHIASSRRDIARTLCFIPQGHLFRGSFVPRVAPRSGFLYIDPATPLADPQIGFADAEFEPRLFFTDPALWTTARKTLRLIEDPDGDGSRLYAETLAAALSIELVRFRNKGGLRPPLERGGLADWQRRIASEFINENLDRDISLEELASLVRLSPTHFCRAFTRSIGMPPHQYQIRQRVERAKLLLADSERSITDVAISTGYSASSNFATAFRRVTGVSPREYRRSLL
jgi:AraC family transcriptional regulator